MKVACFEAWHQWLQGNRYTAPMEITPALTGHNDLRL